MYQVCYILEAPGLLSIPIHGQWLLADGLQKIGAAPEILCLNKFVDRCIKSLQKEKKKEYLCNKIADNTTII